MATYVNPSFLAGIWNRDTSDWLVTPAEASRTYASGDIIKGPQIHKQGKCAWGWLDIPTGLDSNASPTMTIDLVFTDGTTIVKLISLTAAQVKLGGIFTPDESAGLGYVIPGQGWRSEVQVTANAATAVAGTIQWAVSVTALNYSGQDPSSV